MLKRYSYLNSGVRTLYIIKTNTFSKYYSWRYKAIKYYVEPKTK